jgi:hypothetical protein
MNRQGVLTGAAMLWSMALAMPEAAARPAERELSQQPAPSQTRPVTLAMVVNLKQGELGRWTELNSARRPSRIAALAQAFLRDYPQSAHREDARAFEAGALRVVAIKREVGLSGDFFETSHGDAAFDSSLRSAARGDGEAAYRLATMFGEGKSGVSPSLYRQEQWMRFAAELGHARASWDLAQIYNTYGRVADAAHFEKRATELGYKPPPRLSNRDY